MKRARLSQLYKALWSRVGGRPWTYIIRDCYHRQPLIWIMLSVALGILLGHLFWGTPWVPGQTGS
ncbi:MAG: hypothetical protein J7K77_04705 [Dehalococcoidales bacterium]|nr:hypothetical protein [Dehalococcoidales bacterium]